METKVNLALVGAFVLLLSAALVAGLLWIASGGSLRKKVDLYQAIEEESVAGLSVNAAVKYNGVDVGTVREIRLDAERPDRVRLVFAILRGTPIRQDTVAVLKTQGLTGIAYVELSGGLPATPLLRATSPDELPLIRTKPSLSTRLENMMTAALVKLDSTAGRIDAVLSPRNQQAFSDTLANLAAVSHTLAGRRGAIDTGLASAARTFQHGDRLGAQLEQQIGPLVARIGRAADSIDRLGQDAARASAEAGSSVAAAGSDLQRFSGQTLPGLQLLLGELQALSGSLRRLVEQAEQDPSTLVFGRRGVPDGPGESTPTAAPRDAVKP